MICRIYTGVDLTSLEKSILESELNIQCGKPIMQDLRSSGTVQNADVDIQRRFQKLSSIPQDHIDAVWNLKKNIFEIHLKAIKDVVPILDDGKKNYLRNQSHSLEPFEIVYKHHFNDFLGRLQILKKTADELNDFNGACDISELINQLMLIYSLV
ncbi:hypothetical protein TSUD_169220 [Trifolium subterraneum]|nr:hypothetical protein TSUD_169220 [Trifolium subterraneum]